MYESFRHRPAPPQAEWFAFSSVPAISPAAGCRWISRLKAIWRLCLCSSTAVVLFIGVSVAHAEPIVANSNGVVATADPIAVIVAEASHRFAMPSSWIRAVMRAESLDDVRALSPKGAMGLMQIMPETWAELRLRYGLGADPYDPHDNIIAGAAYLRELHDRYGEPGFLAAYNAGPGRYEDHVTAGRPLPPETTSYMAVVASLIDVPMANGLDVAAPMVPSGRLLRCSYCVRKLVLRYLRRRPVRRCSSVPPATRCKRGQRSRRSSRGCLPVFPAGPDNHELDRPASPSLGLWRMFECWRRDAEEPNQRTAREKRRLRIGASGWLG
jgi:hypothetical protein